MVQILQKLLHILNKDQKRKVAGLGVMIFIGALMEMIGVGLIMPVVEGVMAPDQLLNKWYIQILERWIHFDTPNQWLLFLIGVIIAVYFIKKRLSAFADICTVPFCQHESVQHDQLHAGGISEPSL